MSRRLAKYPEDQLIGMLKRASEPAFRELFHRYEQKIFLYTTKFVRDRAAAEELTQDVFVKVWEYREQIDDTLGLSGLIYKIARNHILNALRANVAIDAARKEYSHTIETSHNNTEEKVFFDDYARVLDHAVGRLSPQCRSIFTMSKFEGKSYKEIAVSLGISKDTVRNQMIRSLKLIREYIAEYADLPSRILIVLYSVLF